MSKTIPVQDLTKNAAGSGVFLPAGSAAIVSSMRNGDDLVLTLADGSIVTITGFFETSFKEVYSTNLETLFWQNFQLRLCYVPIDI